MNIWKKLGPGVLLAATSIGASHLVLSPQAGALFGYQLLWLVLAAHLLKYPAFEFGPRYAAATGHNLLHGYARMPGPRGWALWLFLVSTVLQGVGVLAGVVNVCGAVLGTWTGAGHAEYISVGIIVLVVMLLLRGGFNWLDNLNKIMMAVLTLATLLAFIPIFPEPSNLLHLVIPSLPNGSLVLVAAILGWMPTGIDVSIWHSFWTIEKLKSLGLDTCKEDDELQTRCDELSLSLTDMRIGYGLSLATGVMFVTMGAVYLVGQGNALKGIGFIDALSATYTKTMGLWMAHVFMLTAFFAMFSTSYTVIDGFSRSFSEALGHLFERFSFQSAKNKTYLGFILFSASLACITLVLVGNPVTLVTYVALVSLAAAPVLYVLNLLCVTMHIQQPKLRPGRLTLVVGWFGVGTMLLAVGVTIFVKFLR